MTMANLAGRFAVWGAAVLGVMFAAPYADAQNGPDASACADAFESTQVKRRSGQLKGARRSALTCAQEACSRPIRAECMTWLQELEAAIPSVVVTAKDARGADVVSARLFVDEELVAQRLDGKPIELDPGDHELRVELGEGKAVTNTVVLTAGQKGRVVAIPLGAAGGGALGQPSGGISPVAWVGFSVGGVGLLVGTIAGAVALGHPCHDGGCVDGAARTEGLAIAHASTIGFVVGGLGIAVGTIALLSRTAPNSGPPAAAQVTWRVTPGHAAIAGRF